jgi:hypothetical protein
MSLALCGPAVGAIHTAAASRWHSHRCTPPPSHGATLNGPVDDICTDAMHPLQNLDHHLQFVVELCAREQRASDATATGRMPKPRSSTFSRAFTHCSTTTALHTAASSQRLDCVPKLWDAGQIATRMLPHWLGASQGVPAPVWPLAATVFVDAGGAVHTCLTSTRLSFERTSSTHVWK